MHVNSYIKQFVEKKMEALLKVFILLCQIAVFLLFGAAVLDFFQMSGSGLIYYLKCGAIFAGCLFAVSIIPFGEILSCAFVYYWCVWKWDFNPILSFVVIFPGVVVVLGGWLVSLLNKNR